MKYKLSRIEKKILKKYDLNKDNLVSIDEFLSVEYSKGPKADKGFINYDYQHFINIYNFYSLLLLNNKISKNILCIPQFHIKIDHFHYERASTFFDVSTNKYIFPERMINSIKECEKKKIRLIYFSFIIKLSKNWNKPTHSNIIIMDTKLKTLERFEPYGKYTIDFEIDLKINKLILFILDSFKKENLDYSYILPSLITQKLGIQEKGDSYNGMCVTISSLYLHMRILNLDTEQNKIINYFIAMSKTKLKKLILKYAKYIEETLKKNKNLVNTFTKELYEIVETNINDNII